MLGVILGILLVVCAVLWSCAHVQRTHVHPLPPPYPGKLPIIGHAHKLLTDTVGLFLLIKSVAEYSLKPGLIYVKVGPYIFYVLSDPEDSLLLANTCLNKGFMYDFAKNWLGDGLLLGSAQHWHRHRKILNTKFSLPIIHGYLEVFNSQTRELLRVLDPFAGGKQFDPTTCLQIVIAKTSSVLEVTTFGNIDELDDEAFFNYTNAVDEIFNLFTQKFQKFWLQSEFIYKILGYMKKENKLVETLHEITQKITRKRRKVLNESDINLLGGSYQPLLDMILQLPAANSFSDQEIREEMDTAFVTGYDTVKNTTKNILVMIGSFPEVQQKIYEEIMQVLGPERDVEKNDLQKLVYTEAVIKESLRLIPIVPVVIRSIDKNIQLKNYTLRAGSLGAILPPALCRHPSWGPDADQFRPERWLGAASLPADLNVFGSCSLGKRNCIDMIISFG